MLLVNPIGSAALGRMPSPIESLAVWQVLGGLIFMLRSLGVAYNEVVVALLDEKGSVRALQLFATILVACLTALWILLVTTPLANIWFTRIMALDPQLARMAQSGAWFAIPLPAMAVLQSWFQGSILHSRRTGAITEAVVIYLLFNVVTLVLGIIWGKTTGLFIGLGSLVLSSLIQTLWLWLRSRYTRVKMHAVDVSPVQIDN
jgi:O-antigen/teichoic acid export membrane protein